MSQIMQQLIEYISDKRLSRITKLFGSIINDIWKVLISKE